MHRRLLLLLPLLAAACAGPPAAPQSVAAAPPGRSPALALPVGWSGAADPIRRAVTESAFLYAHPERFAGNPAATARAAAQLEYLAVMLPRDQRWIAASPQLFPALRAARTEMRTAYDIDTAASPEAALKSLVEASQQLETNDRAGAIMSLSEVAPRSAPGVLARLDAAPRLPAAARATALAQSEMNRMMQEDNGE